jgi:hypothetical protein
MAMTATRQPISDSSAWSSDDLAGSDEWVWTLDPAEIEELDAALAETMRRDLAWSEVTAADFPLNGMTEKLRDVAGRLETGHGIALIRGLPIERYSLDDLKRLYFGLASHIGRPVVQNGGAGMMREIRDTGGPRVESPAHLNWHTDRADVVVLLCLRQAAEGGISRIVSATRIYNAILETRPDLIDALFDDFYRSSIGDEVGTDAPYYLLPVFSMHDGAFTSDFSRVYITQAQAFPEVPRLTAAQTEALDMIPELAEAMCFERMIQPGDIQLLNNHVTYHARSAYVDDAASGRDRFLLRLWLMTPESRRLPKNQASLWSSAALTAQKQPGLGKTA